MHCLGTIIHQPFAISYGTTSQNSPSWLSNAAAASNNSGDVAEIQIYYNTLNSIQQYYKSMDLVHHW